jgi:hypothetical protein
MVFPWCYYGVTMVLLWCHILVRAKSIEALCVLCVRGGDSRQQTADSRPQTADSRQQAADG